MKKAPPLPKNNKRPPQPPKMFKPTTAITPTLFQSPQDQNSTQSTNQEVSFPLDPNQTKTQQNPHPQFGILPKSTEYQKVHTPENQYKNEGNDHPQAYISEANSLQKLSKIVAQSEIPISIRKGPINKLPVSPPLSTSLTFPKKRNPNMNFQPITHSKDISQLSQLDLSHAFSQSNTIYGPTNVAKCSNQKQGQKTRREHPVYSRLQDKLARLSEATEQLQNKDSGGESEEDRQIMYQPNSNKRSSLRQQKSNNNQFNTNQYRQKNKAGKTSNFEQDVLEHLQENLEGQLDLQEQVLQTTKNYFSPSIADAQKIQSLDLLQHTQQYQQWRGNNSPPAHKNISQNEKNNKGHRFQSSHQVDQYNFNQGVSLKCEKYTPQEPIKQLPHQQHFDSGYQQENSRRVASNRKSTLQSKTQFGKAEDLSQQSTYEILEIDAQSLLIQFQAARLQYQKNRQKLIETCKSHELRKNKKLKAIEVISQKMRAQDIKIRSMLAQY